MVVLGCAAAGECWGRAAAAQRALDPYPLAGRCCCWVLLVSFGGQLAAVASSLFIYRVWWHVAACRLSAALSCDLLVQIPHARELTRHRLSQLSRLRHSLRGPGLLSSSAASEISPPPLQVHLCQGVLARGGQHMRQSHHLQDHAEG